jgi:hypothetical protein
MSHPSAAHHGQSDAQITSRTAVPDDRQQFGRDLGSAPGQGRAGQRQTVRQELLSLLGTIGVKEKVPAHHLTAVRRPVVHDEAPGCVAVSQRATRHRDNQV